MGVVREGWEWRGREGSGEMGVAREGWEWRGRDGSGHSVAREISCYHLATVMLQVYVHLTKLCQIVKQSIVA